MPRMFIMAVLGCLRLVRFVIVVLVSRVMHRALQPVFLSILSAGTKAIPHFGHFPGPGFITPGALGRCNFGWKKNEVRVPYNYF